MRRRSLFVNKSHRDMVALRRHKAVAFGTVANGCGLGKFRNLSGNQSRGRERWSLLRRFGMARTMVADDGASGTQGRLGYLGHDPAILLLGPTGAGKTPLGRLLEVTGIAGRRAVHFDFGEQLRQVVAQQPEIVSPEELKFLQAVLKTGALLEDERFGLALRILDCFLRDKALRSGEWLVLNGLPRHRGQAERLRPYVTVRAVVELQCSPEVVIERIARNVGGDRTGRNDDTITMISKKVEIYQERTQPLVDYYRQLGVPIVKFPVGVETRPEQLAENIRAELVGLLSRS